MVHAINEALGGRGATYALVEPVEVDPVDQTASLRGLMSDMQAGRVTSLLIMDANPVFAAPGFAAALERVPASMTLSTESTETSGKTRWSLPARHALEDWSDVRAYDGTITIMQPQARPLYDGISPHYLLGLFAAADEVDSREAVRRTLGLGDQQWHDALASGVVAGSQAAVSNVALKSDVAGVRLPEAAAGDVTILFRPDPGVWDGRYANNAWLQELPRPLTKLTWDNVATFSPRTAQRLGLANEDVVERRIGQRSVVAPVWILGGQADESVAVTLGYGRQRGASAGQGVGFNAYPLRTSDSPWFVAGVDVARTGQTYKLSSAQTHFSMQGRDLVVSVTPEQLSAAASSGVSVVGQQHPAESLYPGYAYPENRWGMVIDLNTCVGCNACVVACQAENNIPVVGKEEVGRGRDMLWLRVDTYFEGSPDNPRVLQQLVPCMQCETAPCELVCPVGATVHSSEGLNDMVYNRCVGTRYCSNNCPYKVRHFNFFEYSDFTTPTLKLLRNPEVTVRSRGVMEKCTYCVQRITAARVAAEKEDRSIRDGEVVTACQAACPTNSIVFGNLNDASSGVARQRGLARNYTLLADLNTRPRTTYLATVPNKNPALGEA